MGTTVAIAAVSTKIVVSGFLLGVGFWTSKKFTNYLDYRLALRDPRLQQKLALGAPVI